MPTQFMVCKWLCDSCPQLCDSEPECHVHARQMHKHSTSDVHALEQMCTRIDATTTAHELVEYERVSNALLERVAAIKSTQAMAQQQCLTVTANALDVLLAENEVQICQDVVDHDNEDVDEIQIAQTHDQEYRKLSGRMSRNRQFNCDLCKKPFIRKHHLRRHIEAVHERKVDAKFACDVCFSTFTQTSSLNRHRRGHVDTLGRVGKVRTSQINKQQHKPTKHEFTCTVCAREFGSWTNLRLHRIVHENERPYECDRCEMTFKRQCSLRRHAITVHARAEQRQLAVLNEDATELSNHADEMQISIDENPAIINEPDISNVDDVTTPDTRRVRNAKNCSSSTKIFACNFDTCTRTFYTQGGLRQHTRFVHKHQQSLPLCANFKMVDV